MENLETYNRVRSLESPALKFILSSTYLLLILWAVSASLGLFIFKPDWPYYEPSIGLAIISFAILYLYDLRRSKKCQHCRQPLQSVTRPFLFTPKYLSMNGSKQGDYFYTQCVWGKNPFKTRWAKISNQSLACHHCRLTEERQFEHYEAVLPNELEKINLAHQHKAD